MGIIRDQLESLLEYSNFLGELQNGFRRDRHTGNNTYFHFVSIYSLAKFNKTFSLYVAFFGMGGINRIKQLKKCYSLVEFMYKDRDLKISLGAFESDFMASNVAETEIEYWRE